MSSRFVSGAISRSYDSRSFNTTDTTSYDPDPDPRRHQPLFHAVLRHHSGCGVPPSSFSAPSLQKDNQLGRRHPGGFSRSLQVVQRRGGQRARSLTFDYSTCQNIVSKVGHAPWVRRSWSNNIPTPVVPRAPPPSTTPRIPRSFPPPPGLPATRTIGSRSSLPLGPPVLSTIPRQGCRSISTISLVRRRACTRSRRGRKRAAICSARCSAIR